MSISLSDFEILVSKSFALKEAIDKVNEITLKPLERDLKVIDRQILDHLQANEMKSYRSNLGMVSHVRKPSVRVPKTPEEKEALFTWLRAQGDETYYAYVGVNSQSINALYKEELEKAKEEGNFDFVLPGVGEPTFSDMIQRRKMK